LQFGAHCSQRAQTAPFHEFDVDDQLVQSDESRMDWFRALLNEKAHIFQIVVFTADYLPATSLVSAGSSVHIDTDDGFVRAINLERALGQVER
jgi:hypothetical protein